ncbi:hypothetical protein ACFYTG_30355 [Streptomyces mirabilis]|uniref:hypothetical protein n=1 Tax=Streptomyces mirabilis TaxID=68239 RepID=UPI0036A2FAAE
MPSPEARADGIAAELSAAGFAPRLQHHDDRIEMEMEVSSSVSAESWQELLRLLAQADWFGLVSSEKYGRTAWAGVRKNAPATIQAVRGHGHQL